MNDVVSAAFPENAAGGFSRWDGTVQFYQRVRALLAPGQVVLDFGAGRGAAYYEDSSAYRRSLRDLRGEGRRIIGADVDPVVRSNPWMDESVVIDMGTPLPFPDNTFDLILSDSAFEHIESELQIARELDRIVKGGGWICARTPNRYGYVAVANRMVPGRLGNSLVHSAQPDRKAQDIFPAYYRMNSLRELRRLFPPNRYDHMSFAFDSEPRYHFNNRAMFYVLLGLHGLTPPALRNTLMVYMRKRG
jgi:SAM-dependent methyltransferase